MNKPTLPLILTLMCLLGCSGANAAPPPVPSLTSPENRLDVQAAEKPPAKKECETHGIAATYRNPAGVLTAEILYRNTPMIVVEGQNIGNQKRWVKTISSQGYIELTASPKSSKIVERLWMICQ